MAASSVTKRTSNFISPSKKTSPVKRRARFNPSELARKLRPDLNWEFQAWMRGIDHQEFERLTAEAAQNGVSTPVHIRQKLHIELAPPPMLEVKNDSPALLADPAVRAQAEALRSNPAAIRYHVFRILISDDWDDLANELNRLSKLASHYNDGANVSLVQFQRLGGVKSKQAVQFLAVFQIEPKKQSFTWEYHMRRVLIRGWNEIDLYLTLFANELGPSAQLVHFNRLGLKPFCIDTAGRTLKSTGRRGLELISVFKRRVSKVAS